ncbi:MAG: FAD binding domain-containing protein [Candidatus Caldarchaeum sp.]
MRAVPSFEVLMPSSLEEALKMLAEASEDTVVYAGGTDLMPMMRRGRIKPTKVIDLSAVFELSYLRKEGGMFKIGALTTIHDLANSALIPPNYLSLRSLSVYFGAETTRHMATVGGNLASGGERDIPAILASLDAVVKIASNHHTRFSHPLELGLKPSELIIDVSFEDWGSRSVSWFTKFEKRASNGIGVVTVAVSMKMLDNTVDKLRVVLNRVEGRRMDRLYELEEELTGVRLSTPLIKEAVEKHLSKVRPAGDFRASSEFRKHVSKVLIRRGLEFCWQYLQRGEGCEN